ncbi:MULTISPECIES: hypothetical protein [Erysipelothrix]|uniref:hypothetical protein n=1 Tax=Erysipelothrix TaxID=1647 RepID=UPI00140D8DF4|nr:MULTISPECIES: hypothetical protein [Erysipelothrix]MDV7678449.1 hypothetical protein [Erysipelothrix rhusiopathiae]WMT70149.1 hypothetical protein K0H77_01165 [Erysipelothrix rhusiopathiae]
MDFSRMNIFNGDSFRKDDVAQRLKSIFDQEISFSDVGAISDLLLYCDPAGWLKFGVTMEQLGMNDDELREAYIKEINAGGFEKTDGYFLSEKAIQLYLEQIVESINSGAGIPHNNTISELLSPILIDAYIDTKVIELIVNLEFAGYNLDPKENLSKFMNQIALTDSTHVMLKNNVKVSL